MTTAAALISWPPSATDTSSERVRSFRMPAVAITPLPMAKLPNSSAQRARA
jgi:hypothetical protein